MMIQTKETKCKTIMIVENDPRFQELYSEMLKDKDYKIVPADNGSQALARLREKKPDLIILDIALNMVNGDVLFRYLKSNTEYIDIPVIIISYVPLSAYKSLKVIDPYLVTLDKALLTKERFFEEIRAKIG